MTWNAFHRRGDVLRAVVDAADTRRDAILPMDVPGVAEHFRDELDLLSALLLRWHARLSGNIERELMLEPLDLEGAVARAYRRTCDDLPGVRLVVDRYLAAPTDDAMEHALVRAQQREWVRLAHAAGLANDESRAAALAGRRIEREARSLDLEPSAADAMPASAAAQTAETATLVQRIRAVLAA
ncbi:MAG: hypothetical protein ACTHNS_14280 [Marmoricola sp.]